MVLVRCTAKRGLCDRPSGENDAMKRTRVHAQRKFAQGAALSPVTINKDVIKLNGASSSDVSPAKHSGNHSEISEILPSKRPNTEDFLTFLCFRNTSILPARLDFFGAASASTSNKNSGMGLASSRKTASARSEEPNSKPVGKDKASTMTALQQKYRERELLRQKKMEAPKHAQRASAKRLQPVVDRRKQLQGKAAVKRSPRNDAKLKQLAAVKKKLADKKKDSAKTKGAAIANKSPKEAKKPVSAKPQAKNLKPSLMRNSLKSKVKRAPLSLRRGLRSGGISISNTQELSSKSKRLQVIRNRKAKLGANKKAAPSNEPVKPTKRIPVSKAKNIGSDFSSEDDQPLVKKQRTKETLEKPNSSQKVPDAPSSSRLLRRTKETATSFLEILGKDSRSSKKQSNDSENPTEKSQADASNAKKNEEKEKDSKGKANTKTQTKEETSKKEEPKAKSNPKESLRKVQLKRAVIVKKNTVIANRNKKSKLLQARTRSHSVLPKRISNQSRGVKTRRSGSLDSRKQPVKSETEKPLATVNSKSESESSVSTRSTKSQSQSASTSKKQGNADVASSKSRSEKVSKEKSSDRAKNVFEKATGNPDRSGSEKSKRTSANPTQAESSDSKADQSASEMSRRSSSNLTQVESSNSKPESSALEKSKRISANPIQAGKSDSKADQSVSEKSTRSSASLAQVVSSSSKPERLVVEKSKRISANPIQAESCDNKADQSTSLKSRRSSTNLTLGESSSSKPERSVSEKPKRTSANPTQAESSDSKAEKSTSEKSKRSSANLTQSESSSSKSEPLASEKPKRTSANPTQAESSDSKTEKSTSEKSKRSSANLTQLESSSSKSEPLASEKPKRTTVNPIQAANSKADQSISEKSTRSSASLTQAENSENKSELVIRNTRRSSVPSISPPPPLPKNKSKPKDSPSEVSSKNSLVSPVESTASVTSDLAKKSGIKTSQSTGVESLLSVTKTRSSVKTPVQKNSRDSSNLSSDDKIVEKKVSESKTSKEQTKKVEQNSKLRPINDKRLSFSSDEEVSTKLSVLKNICDVSSVNTKMPKNKSDLEKLAKTAKTNTVEPKAKKFKKSANLKDSASRNSSFKDSSGSEVEDSDGDRPKAKKKNKAKSSSKSRPKKLNVNTVDLSSSEDDRIEDNINLAALKTNLSKNSNLSANDKEKNLLKLPLASLKEKSSKVSPSDKKDSNKDMISNQVASDKNVAKVSNLLCTSEKEVPIKKAPNKHSINENNVFETPVFAECQTRSDSRSPSPSRKNRAKSTKSSVSLLKSTEKDKDKEQQSLSKEDNAETEKQKVQKANMASKDENEEKKTEAAIADPKEANHKGIDANTLKTLIKDKVCKKTSEKALFPENEKATTNLKSVAESSPVFSVSKNVNAVFPKDDKLSENNLTNKPMVPKSLNDDCLQAKFVNESVKNKKDLLDKSHSIIFANDTVKSKDVNKPHSVTFAIDPVKPKPHSVTFAIDPVKPKDVNETNLLDNNKLHSKEINSSFKPMSTEQKSNIFCSKELSNIERKESNRVVALGSLCQNKDSNQAKSFSSAKMELKINNPNQSVAPTLVQSHQIYSHQSLVVGNEGSANSKIFNKFEATKKEVNVHAVATKPATKNSLKAQKDGDQATSRIAEPSQEDLVAVSESLIKLSMSRGPFKQELFGSSLKATNNETLKISCSQAQADVPIQNFERQVVMPSTLLKNINTSSSLISTEKDDKFEFLKKCDNLTVSSSKNHLETPTVCKAGQKVRSSVDKNILDSGSAHLKNEFSPHSSSKVSDSMNRSFEKNVAQSPNVESLQHLTPNKSCRESDSLNQKSISVSGANNVNRFATDNSIFNPNQRGNCLQTKKVENADAEVACDASKKNKMANQKRDVVDNSDRSKFLNLKVSYEETRSKSAASSDDRKLDCPRKSSSKPTSSKDAVNETVNAGATGGANLPGVSSKKNVDKNTCETQNDLKNNMIENKNDEKLGARARVRRQSMSKPSNSYASIEDEADKKRSKSSSSVSESVLSPSAQRRSSRIKQPNISSPCSKSRSPSPPPQRVLRERKHTYFGEVDSSDEEEEFNFLLASGKLFSDFDTSNSSSKTTKDEVKSVNRDTVSNDKKTEEKKLVLSKRNNVTAESKSNLKTRNLDGGAESRSQEGSSSKHVVKNFSNEDSTTLKKIDNKNQDVDGAKSKHLDQVSRTKINLDSNRSQMDGSKNSNMAFCDVSRKSKTANCTATSIETDDLRNKSNLISAETSSVGDAYLKNTNTRRHETSASTSTQPSKSNLYQNEARSLKAQNQKEFSNQRPEVAGTNRLNQVSGVTDSKSINTQITNFLHFSPARPASDQLSSKHKNVPINNSSLNVNKNSTATVASTKETNTFQASSNSDNSVVGSNNYEANAISNKVKNENKNVLSNAPSNKIPIEIPKMSNVDTSLLPNNPRTYFNRSLAAAHFKSQSAEMSSVNKNLFPHASNEKQVNQLLKPINKEIKSPQTGNAKKSVKDDSSTDKGKSASSSALPSGCESPLEKCNSSKEPTATSSTNLNASWKNAFKNFKLPKPYPSVPKTPMDRNAWIKKHSAPLKLNKTNEQTGASKSDPFIIKSKPNDIFSATSSSTSSFTFDHKPSNFDVKTVNMSGSNLSSTGSVDLSSSALIAGQNLKSPMKKSENGNQPKLNTMEKNLKSTPTSTVSSLDTGPPSSTNLNAVLGTENNKTLAGELGKEPITAGKHQNLPICVEQTRKQNSPKFTSPLGKKAGRSSPVTAVERDVSGRESLTASPVTSSHKQFTGNPPDKELNTARKNSNVNINQKSITPAPLNSPDKNPGKVASDKSFSVNSSKDVKNSPLSVENFLKPSSKNSNSLTESSVRFSGSSLESSSKGTNSQVKSTVESPTAAEHSNKQVSPKTVTTDKKTSGNSSKTVSSLYGRMNTGAEFFPEPQSQKPSYSSNPTLKKYSQSLSTPTRKSIDGEVEVGVPDTPPALPRTPEGTPEKVTKKVIFQQRRLSITKDNESPKKAVAFSPEHESSVYAFEPDLPPTSTPFRRNKIKNHESASNSNLESSGSSSSSCNNSIAVQVNLETEAVFECSTQTDVEEEEENEGQLFYIPLQQSVTTPSPQIQGVAVKLGTEGPDQRVIMRAKLVTKPPSNYAKKTAATNTVSSMAPLQAVSPEKRKVRPLGASSVDSSAPVGTVQPTSRSTTRDSPSPLASPKSSEISTSSADLSMPSTSSANRSPKVVKRGKKLAPQTNSLRNGFPKAGSPGQIVEAPTFHPTEEEFSDPLEYIEQIRPMAEQFGLCRIVPPSNFKPECKVADDMRFTAYNQFVHRMLHRWGPSSKESAAIRKHLVTENITLKNPPCIGGVELDLPQLYHKVQACGGLKKVMEQDRWQRVADLMKIPKSVHERSSKLDEIYCKYLLPFDTLSPGERTKLFADVEKEWKHHKFSENELFEDIDDCIIKGRSMALNQFYRVARNIMTIHFGGAAADKEIGPDPEEVESQYWEHVSSGQNHICVHSASIDTGPRGYGFPTTKNSTFAKHNWNLKILTNNSGSVLRSLGPIIGVTVPTLHVGMLFTTCCWYKDPHGLPWIEYLHTGASKIWYGIPAEYNSVFRSAMSKLLPSHKRSDQTVWLASDTAMVPPPLLVENGVSLSRIVQQPGQFIVVFPRAFTSSIATGYLLSESVYFAPSSWLQSANDIFLDLQNSCESSIFSLEQLLCSIATDTRTSLEILTQVAPLVSEMRDREVALRSQLEDLGLRATERLPWNNKRKSQVDEDEDYECDTCHANLYISLVSNSFEEVNYCLCHGIELLSKKRNHLKYCKLKYAYTEEELEEIIVKLSERIEQKSQKKPANKSTGGTSTK